MAKSSFFSGTGTTPTNVESVSSSKAAAEASENAAAQSATAAAQSATAAAASATSASGSAAQAYNSANTAGAFTAIVETHADDAEASATAAAASAASVGTSETNAAASETAAAASETAAAASETAAATSETNASNSATAAATSATAASTSATAASASETAAAASETAAAASETAAAASETAAAASESAAATSETNAASSATSASTSATTATTQATNAATSATQASTSATNAATSETNASASETAAAASETAAASSATSAATSATQASTSAGDSATSATSSANSATAAAGSASAASTSATNAATSASDAATSETNASNSATAASNSASAASTSETNAGNSATNAATSATAASNSATAAAASETAAASSESAAATSETNAATSASNASSSATAAAGSATTASTQATNASNSATAAATSETNAANSATSASNSASAASTSATAAASSASSAQASKDAALAALDSFDDRYLGQKTSDPSTDNDGDALVSGALYFNTTSDVMKVYDGSAWVAAYASLSGTLTAANNLSDIDNASDARTNLGLAIGTDVQAYSAALAGTTASYTTAEETKLAGIETGATADQTAAEIRSLVESATDSNVFTDADHTKLNGIESGATADQTAAEILTAIKTVDGSGSGLDADTLDGSHASAFLTGNQTITLTGDASGSGTTSINVTVANDSHTHDGRYYTETEADARFLGISAKAADADLLDGYNASTGSSTNTVVVRNSSGYIFGNYFNGSGTFSTTGGTSGMGLFTGTNGSDTYGRSYTAAAARALLNVENGATADQTITAGSGLTGGGTGDVTISHSDTSSQASVNNSGATVIQDVTLDTYGHVTGLASKTMTLADLGYTGATNANYITNNNQLTNGAGYITSADGGNAATLDGIDSSSFLRSDANDSMSGRLTLTNSNNDFMEYNGSATNPYFRFKTNGTANGNVQFTSGGTGYFWNDRSSTGIRLQSGNSGLSYYNGSSYYTIWHSANDGSGSGLDADLWDGNQFSSYLNQAVLTSSSPTFSNAYIADYVYHSGDTNTYIGFPAADNIAIATGGTNRIYVDNSGVRIGDTGNAYVQPVSGDYGSFQIDGGSHNSWEGYSIGGRIVFMHDNSTASGVYNDVNNHWFIQFINQGKVQLNYNTAAKLETTSGGVAVTGALTATGNITAYYSDERLKTKTGDLEGALEKIKQLNGFYYVENDLAKELGFDNDQQQVALSAQEVQAVMPEAVSLAPFDMAKDEETGDTLNVSASGKDYLTVDYARLVPLLVEAIKEQQAQIDELKAKLEG